jgi:hypothetical protein
VIKDRVMGDWKGFDHFLTLFSILAKVLNHSLDCKLTYLRIGGI